jgi:hypothetical protein
MGVWKSFGFLKTFGSPAFIFPEYIITSMSNLFDFSELVKRAIKYIVEGIIVAIAAYSIPKRSLNVEEVVIIALTAAATFSVLDVFAPSFSSSARGGAGFGLGANLVGFPGGL